jgi:4,5-DOPA dioxygenase extradiol
MYNKQKRVVRTAKVNCLFESIPLLEGISAENKKGDSIQNRLKSNQVLFIGHGHPMNALFDNHFTRTLHQLGRNMERPQAIMVVSAHWLTRGSFVSVNPKPQTIHDFGPFDDRLFEMRYDAPGHPSLAREAIEYGRSFGLLEDQDMGLDHGAWTVLHHLYPAADIPVFQLSIDYGRSADHHFELAASLRKLRDRGVLILASGNIVHNLRILNWEDIDAPAMDWSHAFDEIVKSRLDTGDFRPLVDYHQFGTLAKLAIPTPDHYFPMIYAIGLANPSDQVRHIFEGFQYGSVSMRCFMITP